MPICHNTKRQIDLDVVVMATGFDPIGSFASAFDMGGDIQFDKEKELYENAPKAYLGSCLVESFISKNNANYIHFTK